ncbi:MAG: histidine kinase dimerization/phospho-acceptor domain-containing protein, partial [Phormidesmis sp.]
MSESSAHFHSVTDDTASKMAKAEADVQLYVAAVQNMQIGLLIWQLEDANQEDSRSSDRLRLIATNPAAYEFLGMPKTEIIVGKTIAEAFPALVETNLPAAYAEVARGGQKQTLGEVSYEDSRVKKGIFSVKAFPLPGQCVGVAFENITVRKRYEQRHAEQEAELKDANIRLQHQKNDLLTVNLMLTNTLTTLEQRNQELDQFAYVTSHDLKAPLRAIANLATWIEEDIGADLPAENKEQFELLKSRVQRMEGLINGLLEYSRIGRTHQSHERLDVAALLAEVIDSISPSDEFTIEVAPNMPVIEATKIPLTQIFSN